MTRSLAPHPLPCALVGAILLAISHTSPTAVAQDDPAPVVASSASAESAGSDRVWHEPAARPAAQSDWLPQALLADVGTVTEMDATALRLRNASGEITAIATDRIVWIAPRWSSDEARQGMADFEGGRFEEAIPNLLAAIQSRPAIWQQQWLTGHLAIAATEAGRFPAALELVQQLERSDPPVPMLALLPIQWNSRPAHPTALAAARQAISARESSVRLVAASWLLSSPGERELAERTLDVLTTGRGTPPWVARLAEAVRWRRTPVPRIAQASERWIEEIDRMPIILQGGPMLVAADRLQAAGELERARELYLSVALLARHPRTLADQARQALTEMPRE